jgi:hypothetical protein
VPTTQLVAKVVAEKQQTLATLPSVQSAALMHVMEASMPNPGSPLSVGRPEDPELDPELESTLVPGASPPPASPASLPLLSDCTPPLVPRRRKPQRKYSHFA